MGIIVTSVSITDDLKKKMAQHPDINWSSIAREAFQAKLDERTRQQAIDRLRATQPANRFTQGHEAGTAWATTKATHPQLTELTNMGNTFDPTEFRRITGVKDTNLDYCSGFAAGAIEFFEAVEQAL